MVPTRSLRFQGIFGCIAADAGAANGPHAHASEEFFCSTGAASAGVRLAGHSRNVCRTPGVTDLQAPLRDAGRQAASLAETSHRPWPVPAKPWFQGQTWLNLAFVHWPVEPDAIRQLVPRALELDVYERSAWLGVTPFVLASLRIRGLPPLPPLSTFPELNVRTYVTVGGKPGIFFFSLDAASRLAVTAARRFYRLPYYLARMSARYEGSRFRFGSERIDRRGHAASFCAEFEAAGEASPAEPGSLVEFLVERYCLYTVDERGAPLRGEIHHSPWRVRPAVADIAANSMPPPALHLAEEAPLVHLSERQDVVIWKLAPAT
jgi:uncharacterized protein YqjF (DUF2071 family)